MLQFINNNQDMKNPKVSLVFLFGLFMLSIDFQSCKHDPPNPGPEDLGFFGLGVDKDYVYFKKGTWWVYQNNRTGLFDTIKVIYNILDTSEQTGLKWKFTEEVFAVDSRSLTTGHYYLHFVRYQGTSELFKPVAICLPNMERREPYEGDIAAFYYPFDRHKNKPNGNYDTHCITIKDTMTIHGKVYSDVAVFYIKNDDIEPDPLNGRPAKYYWARHYGLVQKDLFDGKFRGDTTKLYHSWKLINSKIIQ